MLSVVRWVLTGAVALGSQACVTVYELEKPEDGLTDFAADKKSALASWSRVLERHVDKEGRVNFAAVRDNPQDLERFVAFISRYSPLKSPQLFPSADEQMAFYLDSYNALAMYGVIRSGIPDGFTTFFKRLAFFKLKEYRIGGDLISLYDYENNTIRGLGEPRVHFALNCMSVGCPRLPQVSYSSGNLQNELDAGAKEFFGSEKYLRVDHNGKVVHVSEILSFFTEDFVNPRVEASLLAYINRYANPKIPEGYTVEFIPYDWNIQRQ
jgi:hypothetical protein